MKKQMETMPVLIRIASKEREGIWKIIFSRYLEKEWGTFIRLGWHESDQGLVFTINGIDEPCIGDLNENNWMTEINSQYIRKVVRYSREHPFAVGFVHSHPEDCETYPSELDDDMESYCAELLHGYHDKPFVSLIFSRSNEVFSASGRVYWKGKLYTVTKFIIENCPVALYNFKLPERLSADALKRVARLASVFSTQSAQLLANVKVGIVGVSGTGSPVAELLTRAGVGEMVLADFDTFSDSNLERVHGSVFSDIGTNIPKVLLAKRHIESINPDCIVTAIEGRLPQQKIVDYLLWCDIVIGCTDQYSSRIGLTELSMRYNIPVIDVGVNMEGKDGHITGQVVQVNRLFPRDPCVYCREMIDPQLASQELMSEEELESRMSEAEKAAKENRAPNAYWKATPQLNTVGYLTTLAGSLVSGYVIGFLTGRFDLKFDRIEINLGRKGLQVAQRNKKQDSQCMCQIFNGFSDQAPQNILITAPGFWPEPVKY